MALSRNLLRASSERGPPREESSQGGKSSKLAEASRGGGQTGGHSGGFWQTATPVTSHSRWEGPLSFAGSHSGNGQNQMRDLQTHTGPSYSFCFALACSLLAHLNHNDANG